VERYNKATTPAQARGNIFELAIGAWYAQQTGTHLQPGPPIGQPGELGPEPWMHCRVDFRVWESAYLTTDADRILECKTTRQYDDEWGAEGTDAVPVHYLVQCVWQMACTGIERTDLAAFSTWGDDFRIYTIYRDLDVERAIVDAVRAWYQLHVIGGVLPGADGSDGCKIGLGALMARRPKPKALREATADEAAMVARYFEARDEHKAVDGEVRALKNIIAESILDDLGLTYQGERIVRLSRRAGSASRRPSFSLLES
jgi:predicted phage-related endonuclease